MKAKRGFRRIRDPELREKLRGESRIARFCLIVALSCCCGIVYQLGMKEPLVGQAMAGDALAGFEEDEDQEAESFDRLNGAVNREYAKRDPVLRLVDQIIYGEFDSILEVGSGRFLRGNHDEGRQLLEQFDPLKLHPVRRGRKSVLATAPCDLGGMLRLRFVYKTGESWKLEHVEHLQNEKERP